MIQHIAQIFGLTEIQFNSIKESRKSSDKLNPYIVLESKPDDEIEIIRKRYLKLSKEHHPDLLMSKGVPPEVIDESKKGLICLLALKILWLHQFPIIQSKSAKPL